MATEINEQTRQVMQIPKAIITNWYIFITWFTLIIGTTLIKVTAPTTIPEHVTREFGFLIYIIIGIPFIMTTLITTILIGVYILLCITYLITHNIQKSEKIGGKEYKESEELKKTIASVIR